MSNKSKGERHVRVRGGRQNPPDLRKLSRALIQLAIAQAEADAQAEHRKAAAEEGKTRGA
jgi:hypothetical protein